MAFSVVIRSCNGLKSLFPAKAGIVELCASFAAADLNMVDDNWEVWSYEHAKLIIICTNLQSLCVATVTGPWQCLLLLLLLHFPLSLRSLDI